MQLCTAGVTSVLPDAVTVTFTSESGHLWGGPSSVQVQYSCAMNTQSACTIHLLIVCLCQRRGGTLARFLELYVCA